MQSNCVPGERLGPKVLALGRKLNTNNVKTKAQDPNLAREYTKECERSKLEKVKEDLHQHPLMPCCLAILARVWNSETA